LGYCGFEAVPSNVEQSALSISNVEQNALSISNVEQNGLSISNVEEKRGMRAAGRANLGMLLKLSLGTTLCESWTTLWPLPFLMLSPFRAIP
jgi:hypothetical protein